MNTDDKFCIQITSQSVNFKESTSLSSSFRLLQGHCKVQAILLLDLPSRSLGIRPGSAGTRSSCPTSPGLAEEPLPHAPLGQGLVLLCWQEPDPAAGAGRGHAACPPRHLPRGSHLQLPPSSRRHTSKTPLLLTCCHFQR